MLFNSREFALFFPLVTVAYFLLGGRARVALLLAASAVFYMAFIPVYLLILVWLIGVDYVSGLLIEGARGRRRTAWLVASIASNLGVLAVFKYWDFAASNLGGLAQAFGISAPLAPIGLVLPIGLSFHTFQSLSYTIEVYRGSVRAERSLLHFALYVLFYPQLVAGPIERPANLLPQLHVDKPWRHEDVAHGLRLMAWGFFKKVVVADRLGVLVDHVYSDPTRYTGAPLLVATLFFSWQIYCDFSGYSDIAIGAARVMGIRLMTNFDRPYAATSIADFWRRWHISLSSWFRDYVYIPLGGRRCTPPRHLANVLVTFLLSGLWHGANWTFVAWGAFHGLCLIASILTSGLRQRLSEATGLARVPVLRAALARTATFGLVTAAWVFFRAGSMADAWHVFAHMFDGLAAFTPSALAGLGLSRGEFLTALAAITALELVQSLQGKLGVPDLLRRLPRAPRLAADYALVLIVLLLGHFRESPFIYFQF